MPGTLIKEVYCIFIIIPKQKSLSLQTRRSPYHKNVVPNFAPMQQKFIIASILLLFSSSTDAQKPDLSVELSSGISFSKIRAVNEMPGSFRNQTSLNSNLSLQWNLIPSIFIETQLGIMQNGYYYYYQDIFDMIYYKGEESYFRNEELVTHRNINNDWLLGFSLGRRIKFKISGGVYYSFYLNSKKTYRSTTYFDPDEYDNFGDSALPIGYSESSETDVRRDDYISPWDFGLIGQFGIGYKLNQKFSISLLSDYYFGIMDVDQSLSMLSYSPENYNRSLVLKIGLRMKI